jgi:hypothetical protein
MNENKLNIDIEQMLQNNKETIVQNAMLSIQNHITEHLNYDASGEIRKTINDFVIAEIAPELKNYLETHKEEILDAYIKAISEGMLIVGNRLVQNVTENMSSYRADEIIKKLLVR